MSEFCFFTPKDFQINYAAFSQINSISTHMSTYVVTPNHSPIQNEGISTHMSTFVVTPNHFPKRTTLPLMWVNFVVTPNHSPIWNKQHVHSYEYKLVSPHTRATRYTRFLTQKTHMAATLLIPLSYKLVLQKSKHCHLVFLFPNPRFWTNDVSKWDSVTYVSVDKKRFGDPSRIFPFGDW